MKNKKVMIIGDVMLDQDIHSNVTRVSPEAPTLIINPSKLINKLGGAAKTAEALVTINSNRDYITEMDVTLIGVLGDDKAKDIIKEQVKEIGIYFRYIVDFGFPTTVKKRYSSNNIPIVRVDEECSFQSKVGQKNLVEAIRLELGYGYDAILISDYEKGVLTKNTIETILAEAKKQSVPVYVDPKNKNIFLYQNCDVVKMNWSEFKSCTDNSLENKDNMLILATKLGCNNLIVTRGSDTILVQTKSLYIEYQPTRVLKDVINVVGAGDFFIAKLTECLVMGDDIGQAVNQAMGYTTTKLEMQ